VRDHTDDTNSGSKEVQEPGFGGCPLTLTGVGRRVNHAVLPGNGGGGWMGLIEKTFVLFHPREKRGNKPKGNPEKKQNLFLNTRRGRNRRAKKHGRVKKRTWGLARGDEQGRRQPQKKKNQTTKEGLHPFLI